MPNNSLMCCIKVFGYTCRVVVECCPKSQNDAAFLLLCILVSRSRIVKEVMAISSAPLKYCSYGIIHIFMYMSELDIVP